MIFGDNLPDIFPYLSGAPKLSNSEIINMFSMVSRYSDNTLYQEIYRVEPGHRMWFSSNAKIKKEAFWKLDPHGEVLNYSKEEDYLENFSALMKEATEAATKYETKIAAEFSAGIDSSAVYCAALDAGIKPELFMHAAPTGSEPALRYKDELEKILIEGLQITQINRVLAENFDPISTFKTYAQYFAGCPPYTVYMFAQNIHQAVSSKGYPILLSGFGGDQGVSHHMHPQFIVPDLINQKKYKQAWLELRLSKKVSNPIRRFLEFGKFSNPLIFKAMLKMQYLKTIIQNKSIFQCVDPYYATYFSTLRRGEWSFLQGPFSYEIRMRIEYSSIISKMLGFEYRYPLLYPKLLEFYLSLPYSQKIENGKGRIIMRKYLAKKIKSGIFDNYEKKHGLDISPATVESFKKQYKQVLKC